MKQTKLMAIMQAQQVYTIMAMAGYQVSMSNYSNDFIKQIEVTTFYKTPEQKEEIEKNIKNLWKYGGDTINYKNEGRNKWINYITYYE